MTDELEGDSIREGIVPISGFDLPQSRFLSERSRRALLRWEELRVWIAKNCPGHWADPVAVPQVRKFYDEHWYPPLIDATRALYDATVQRTEIAGVDVEVFSPAAGFSAKRQRHVLINLHAGGFTIGAPHAGRLESIPIAALGGFKVVSVDYRMAPEFEFPAATDDVVMVYRELLKSHRPMEIGIYGCSSGAVLTSQVVARLQAELVPLPAAVGMFCGAGSYWSGGDSAHLVAARFNQSVKYLNEHPFFTRVDPADPLVSPSWSADVLAKFPPSLLIAATRDQLLSSVVHMHSRLFAAGVQAQLHVWEGLDHAFFHLPDLPESRQVHEITAAFFDRHLHC